MRTFCSFTCIETTFPSRIGGDAGATKGTEGDDDGDDGDEEEENEEGGG